MICPACGNKLFPIKVGGVTIDICRDGCKGLWFDNFELQKLDQPHEPLPPTLATSPSSLQSSINTGKRPCPRCEDVFLKRRFFSPARRVEVDECGGCGGIWLDDGELEKIRQESADKLKFQLSEETDFTLRVLYQYLQTGNRE